MEGPGGSRRFNSRGSGSNSNPVKFSNLSGENLLPPGRGRSRGNWGFRNRFRPYGRGRGGSPRNHVEGYPSRPPSPEHNSPPRNLPKQIKIDEQYVKTLSKKYPGFSLYFPDSRLAILKPWEKLEFIGQYLKRNEESLASYKVAKCIEEQEYWDILYDSLINDSLLMEQWPSFPAELVDNPEDVLNLFGLAVHTIVVNAFTAEKIENSMDDNTSACSDSKNLSVADRLPVIPFIQIRLMKTEPLTPLKLIKSSFVGKFITIRGAVVRTGNVRPYCTHMTCLCSDCSGRFRLKLSDGVYTTPTRCGANLDCKGKVFEPVENHSWTKLIDERKIRLQDVQGSDAEKGSVPRIIDCNLYNSMVELCCAGDIVTICGIVKMSKEVSSSYSSVDKALHKYYLEVIALRNHKDSERTMGGHWFSFSNKDYYAIKEIHDMENLFRLLVASICPAIFGHELVKAGILLSLFGGTPSDQTAIISPRSDINVLIVGDPGLGKSQILNIVSELAPRGVYVCGTSSTVAGLTVTMVKDGDEHSLEAGALVMADRGVCCIDEFDKMQSHHSALLEAMEQQSISIAKAGIFRTLAARTSVIAAANPAGGHYDKSKTVGENIRINSALLSRFDLTFILLDTPNAERDKNIVQHLMAMRGTQSSQRSTSTTSCSSQKKLKDQPLIERLKFDDDEEADLISHHLIRKYIAYAKLYVKPVLSPEAIAVIKEYYLRLRSKHRHINATPVTTRQLESLMRLTQARAKVELREIATTFDANDAIEIFEHGMSEVFDNDIVVNSVLSQISASMSSSTITTPSSRPQTKSQAKKLISALQKLSDQQSKTIFSVDEIKQLGRALGLSGVMDSLISSLNNEGLLLHKGGKIYQLQCAGY